MSKKSKGLILESTSLRGSFVGRDDKALMRHQTLMQDYQELLKETDDTRSKLDAAKQRKLTLAAEVRLQCIACIIEKEESFRILALDLLIGAKDILVSLLCTLLEWFLRRRYQYLVKTKAMDLSAEQKVVQPPYSLKQTKHKSGKLLGHKEASHRSSLPGPEPKSKKRRYIGKEVSPPSASHALNHHHKKILSGRKETTHSLAPISVLKQKGRISISKENFAWNADLNHKERMHVGNDTTLTKSVAPFDLNEDNSPSVREAFLATRTPIFDLNEISTGDEDFQSNVEAVKFEEATKSLIRGLSDEQQNDLKLPVCRNAGESSSRAGKRKISWQDPVALRV